MKKYQAPLRFTGQRLKAFDRPERPHPPHGPPVESNPRPFVPPTTADFAMGPDYPRPWMYHVQNGAGAPLLVGSASNGLGGTYNTALLDALAKFPYVTVHGSPFGDQRAGDLIPLLQQRNPRIIVHWYQTLMQQIVYLTPGYLWKDCYDACIAANSGFRSLAGNSFPSGFPGAAATFWTDLPPIIQSFIAIFLNRNITNVDAAHRAAGMFLDFSHGLVAGSSFFDGTQVDPAASGYANIGALNAANSAALDTFVKAMKQNGAYVGNGNATAASKQLWTGELFENWTSGLYVGSIGLDGALALIAPYMGAGVDGGGRALLNYYDDDVSFTPQWCKGTRFTLGSATLYGGYGHGRPVTDSIGTVPRNMAELWADEYAVTPIGEGGVHDPTGRCVGWMGRPVDRPAKDGATGVWVRHFSKGAVLVNGTSITRTVDMGTPYRRIQGAHDPTTNNGATQQSVSVPSMDAVFLLKL